ncbi:MAG: molybdopterin molybdotransferase MoeA [Caulobacteraceae bacterium]
MSKNLSVDDARARMLAGIAPGAPEPVTLDRFAVGRTLAEPIAASRDQPPFDASAMDGWAVGETDDARLFQVVGESAAGHGFDGRVGPGQAIRVFTGAPVPAGCVVIIQEDSERDGDQVRFTVPVPPARTNVRRRGGDFAQGEVLLQTGMRLDALRLSVAASAGRAQALVARKPRVAILSTGEELVRPGEGEPGPYQIFESNGTTLETVIASWGGEPHRLVPARDNEEAIIAALDGVEADLIVTVGGASVGDYDLVKPALSQLGLEMIVSSIRLRPGKPTWFGRLDDGRRVLGLPGNPASAMVAAELFLRPLLLAWQGADPILPMETARLTASVRETGPREQWMRAHLSCGTDGVQVVTPFLDQDSSLVSVFARSNALMRRAQDAPAAAMGAVVDVLRLDRL